ncbi:MAG: KEOPS complex subunit Pcc1 [Candidatus Hadarchaeum sp.]|uniref:KEOPS complex subunit Pcc1 n=1 Tax=Candidatus Hadarchaeum sp. TaxID=2883567 RepID=UPI00317F2676
MKMQAKVICEYEKDKMAKAVAKALAPDNLGLPKGMQVSTVSRGNKVVSLVKLDGKLETLLATLDDLLACTLTAESML